MKEERIRALEGLVNPTPEQRAAAKALGLEARRFWRILMDKTTERV